MPPSVQTASSSNRRSTGPMRQRENRTHIQHPQNLPGYGRRRKSRSPDARVAEDMQPQAVSDALARRKKKLPPIPSSSAAPNTGMSRLSVNDDSGDRGRIRSKSKQKAFAAWVDGDDEDMSIVTNIVQDHHRSNTTQSARSKRKERSRSREAAHRHSRKAVTPEPIEEDSDSMYTGPLAHAEYTRMKQEMESLRKQVTIAKKTITKQSKVIDELRAELTTTSETQRTQSLEMEKLKTHTKKSDDLVATIESNLTCQICMEILLRPYGLSPCGHVLCMNCLLGWFKAAPAGEDEMVDDDYPDAILYRKKTCPCCRAVVQSRPIQLFLVKSLASAVEKSKAVAGTARPSPPPDTEDPWAGIFRDPEDYWSTDEDEEDDDEEDDEDDEDGEIYEDDEDDFWSFDGYGTGEDEEPYNGPYVNARWSPPTVHIERDDFPFLVEDAEEFAMLRRGATLQMIELFEMSYDHDTGLCAVVEGGNTVYLGWHVELHPDDETGEEYMDWILTDMFNRPERWRVISDEDSDTWNARRLVPEDEDADYSNSDSDAWADFAPDEDEDEDDDF
ncbi:hypothetical protein C8Q80DRAFT_1133487 [Daedaleopsis nitida]|nr:hypothetical protein C8Q80DRAFT_1133487 [Daedaleopsis nitida]